MTEPISKLGIIAGGGVAPRRTIDVCRATGRPYFVFALEGQVDAETLAGDIPHIRIAFGAANALREKARAEGIRDFVMIGRVRRPSLAEIKPDWLALKALTRIGLSMLGDDGLLRAIAGEFEREGFRIIGVQEIYHDLLMPAGLLSREAPDDIARSDIARGVGVARALGLCDVGQAVIVQQGIVLGIEAIEGTESLIARAAGLKRAGPGGVLVKLRKPSQDKRFDLPSIGPETVAQAAAAGLRGIAAMAEETLLIDRNACRDGADRHGLFLLGLTSEDAASA